MNGIWEFDIADVAPDRTPVFEHQGMPDGLAVPARIVAIFDRARGLLAARARPVGVVRDIAGDDFAAVYEGEGANAPRTPVGDIFRRARSLALFAVTLGAGIGEEIAERFHERDLALGAMLDSAASVATDNLAAALERRYAQELARRGHHQAAGGVLRYSPGYCGWHVSGQRRLFAYLEPERIGITLRESCLMDPLKSVSGVLIAGPRDIHRFKDDYEFCDACDTRGCRERLRALYAGDTVRTRLWRDGRPA